MSRKLRCRLCHLIRHKLNVGSYIYKSPIEYRRDPGINWSRSSVSTVSSRRPTLTTINHVLQTQEQQNFYDNIGIHFWNLPISLEWQYHPVDADQERMMTVKFSGWGLGTRTVFVVESTTFTVG